MSEFSIVILNAILYLLVTIYSFRITNDFLKLTSIIWSCSAILSVFYFLNPFNFLTNKITIIPFVYLFVIFLITASPLLSLKSELISTKKIRCNEDIFNFLVLVLSICSIEPFLEILYFIFSKGIGELGTIYTEGKFAKGYSETNHFSFFGKLLFSIVDYFKFVSIPLTFLYLSRGKNKYILIGLILASIIPTLNSLAHGQRFLVMFLALSFIFNYLLFRPFISLNRLKSIKRIGMLGAFSVGLIVVSISITRFGAGTKYSADGYGTFYQFIRYFGESFCNFNSFAYHLTEFLDGQNSWSSYYAYFTNDGLDILEKNRLTGITVNIFYTFIGSFVLDYGLLKTFLILCLLAFFGHIFVKSFKRDMKFGSLILINLYTNILLFGTTYFIYQNGFIHFLWAIFLSFFINTLTKKYN